MFKKRLAVLGAVAVFAITGLSGAALADDHGPTAGTNVTCTTSDGTTVENPPALPKGAKIGLKQGVVVSQDGTVTRLGSNEAGQSQSGLPGKPNLTTPSDAPDVTSLPDGSEQAAPSGAPNLTPPSGNGTDEPANVICIKAAE